MSNELQQALEARLAEIMPLFEEARDALTAITLASAKLHRVDLSLAERMDEVGTKYWRKPIGHSIKLVPIRQLFDHEGNQVCNLGSETCHFYVLPATGGLCNASCNHCQRGIPNNRPHRLCPVLAEAL